MPDDEAMELVDESEDDFLEDDDEDISPGMAYASDLWESVDDDEYQDVVGAAIGVTSGEDAEAVFEAVFGDDDEEFLLWLESFAGLER